MKAERWDWDGAARGYREIVTDQLAMGDRAGAALTRVALARCLAYTGDLPDALRTAYQALVEIEHEPIPIALALQIIALTLVYAGKAPLAMSALRGAWTLRERIPVMARVRLGWLQGRILGAVGSTDKAILLLRDTRTRFEEEGNKWEAALVSLEIAALLAEKGEGATALEDVMEVLPQLRQVYGPHLSTVVLRGIEESLWEAASDLPARLRRWSHSLESRPPF